MGQSFLPTHSAELKIEKVLAAMAFDKAARKDDFTNRDSDECALGLGQWEKDPSGMFELVTGEAGDNPAWELLVSQSDLAKPPDVVPGWMHGSGPAELFDIAGPGAMQPSLITDSMLHVLAAKGVLELAKLPVHPTATLSSTLTNLTAAAGTNTTDSGLPYSGSRYRVWYSRVRIAMCCAMLPGKQNPGELEDANVLSGSALPLLALTTTTPPRRL
jgi:hypothetical protein